MAVYNFMYNCGHQGKIEIDHHIYDAGERYNIIDDTADNDCLECKNKKVEKFDFARMTLTIKKGYVVTGERNQETVESEVTNLLRSFEEQAREKGFMFNISSFRMINEE